MLKEKLHKLSQQSSTSPSSSPKQRALKFKGDAIKAVSEKKTVWAETQLGRCLGLDRSNSDCNKLLAILPKRKGDDLGAIKFYKRYLKHTPKAPDREHLMKTLRRLQKKSPPN